MDNFDAITMIRMEIWQNCINQLDMTQLLKIMQMEMKNNHNHDI